MEDMLYKFSQWLASTWISPFAIGLNDTAVSQWLDTHFLAIPILQVIHILALATGFGAVLMIDLGCSTSPERTGRSPRPSGAMCGGSGGRCW